MPVVFLELQRDGEQYVGRCWQEDDRQNPARLSGLRLGPADTVAIPDLDPPHAPRLYALQQLVDALIRFHSKDLRAVFEERGQVTLGKYLWNETLGKLDRYAAVSDVDLRILTDDEHLAALPWPLLMRNEVFVTIDDWTISLVTRPGGLKPAELPPSPRLLMVAPEPAGVGATKWSDHYSELKQLLEAGGPQLAAEDHFRCVHTWQQFQDAVSGADWDAIYYYGHGLGDRNQSRLLFEADGGGQVERAMGDVADALRTARRPPCIVYVNCCLGDAGGLVGAGRQLSAIAPCVVTNRTVASVQAARAQACAFWRQVLLQGTAPHRAVARNYQQLGDIGLDRIKPYWFTPVLHVRYSDWVSHPPRKLDRREYDPHWKVKLDRVDQFGRVSLQVREMLLEHKPRTLAFVWYGQAGQGMQQFHERLEVDLPYHVGDAAVIAYRPRWPDYADDVGPATVAQRGYEEKLWEAFEVDSLDRICARVRRDAGVGRAVVVLNFPHVAPPANKSLKPDMDPKRLARYLSWWDDYVVPRLEDRNHYFLLGFSFQPADCGKLHRALDRGGFGSLELRHTAVGRLPPLECIARDDLLDFLRRHNIYVPPQWREQYLDIVLRKTQGHYEATLRELEKAVIDGYAQLDELAKQAAEQLEDEDDTGMR